MLSKIKTLWWYVKHPQYYSQFLKLINRRIVNNVKENSDLEAIVWCKSRSLSTHEFLSKLGLQNPIDFEELFDSDYQRGVKLANEIPVKMGGPGNLTLLYYLVKEHQSKNVIETGIAYGWSSLAILKAMDNVEDGKLISTDLPYAKMDNEEFVGLVVPQELHEKWEIIRLPDISGLPKALNKFDFIDLCHYDSDKSYGGRLWAYPLLWNKIRSKGIFVSDDIGDNIAFKEFAEEVGVEPYVVKMANQFVGVLIKP